MAKFKESQRVTLKSNQFPELNGEYVIAKVHDPIAGQVLDRTNAPNSDACYELVGLDGFWAEHSLSAKG